ncbi:MAG TPA: L,D-transpeptidase family protein [Anaerolineaceae bacterium]|jgi:lipoprotein-anchoring transpeptidase ErfK/SrfK|nr:L,D-transpeptidase family protein [Anaerolineaceae bacterium]
MTTIPDEKKLSTGKKYNVKRWMLIIGGLLVLSIISFEVWANSSNRMMSAGDPNGQNPAGLSETANAATSPVPATATATAAATSTPTSTPTPVPTFTPTATPEVVTNPKFDNVAIYTGPGEYYEVMREVDRSETLTLAAKLPNSIWVKVRMSDGQEGWVYTSLVNAEEIGLEQIINETPIPTPIPTPVMLAGMEGHWIDIDLGDQMLYAWDGSELKGSFLVSTGTDDYLTETGRYKIYAKFPFSTMDGGDFWLPDVPWTMFYSGDFSIHGTYWHHNFGTPMSHGCVNMSVEDAEWLYNFSDIGTVVNIHY